ncbi:MAG: ScyD/ScyE family protein [Xenococcaceae cyanobacterium]
MQSVPTSVVIGPDGALYVTELTGFPFPQNGARIYRLDDGTLEIFLDGFTNPIDLAFAPNGDLYVLEYATNSTLSGDPTGALIQVKPNGDRTTILSDELINPTALAIAPDNSIYISNQAFLPGEGEILRVQVSTPEPSSLFGLLGITIGAVTSNLKRKKNS